MAPPLTSVTAALDKAGVGKFQWWLLTYTGLAWAADACEMMILSYLGPSAACSWPDTVGPFQESILTSVVFVGMLVGVYAMGALADTIGRKKGFLASALLLAAAGVASALSPSFTWLVILRGLLGLALGGTPIALTLFAEFLPSARRGVLVLLLQGAWTVGTCAEAVLAWLVIPTLGWRWLLALSAFPMIVLLAGYPLLPESPHWLVTQGRSDEAAQIVRRVAQVNGVALDVSLEEMSFLQASQPQGDGEGHGSSRIGQHDPHGTQEESNHSSHTATCSTVPQQRLSMTFKATFDFIQKATSHFFSSDLAVTTSLLWLVWFVNAITYYGLVLLTTELQNSDGSEAQCTQDGKLNFKSSEFAAVLLTTVAEAPGILLAALFVDNIGRLWCVRGGLTICGAFILSLIGVEAHVGQLALLFLARACVEGTFSVLYIYTPELFPTRFRSFGLAMCNGFARLGGLTAPFLTVYLVESGKTKFAVGLLGSLTVLAGVASFLMPLETKGRDLQAESWRAELRSSEDGNIEECKGRSTIPSNSILSQSSSLGIETKRTRME